jgi:hypothetical protein
MVAIRHWRRTNTVGERRQFESSAQPLTPEASPKRQDERSSEVPNRDVPIFCAGGCGEVVGYLPKGLAYEDKGYEHWCPACEAVDMASKRPAKASSTTAEDELAGLLQPDRDASRLRLLRAATVGLIIAGSIFIAMGFVVGIYLAVIGTLAWFAVCFALWRQRE